MSFEKPNRWKCREKNDGTLTISCYNRIEFGFIKMSSLITEISGFKFIPERRYNRLENVLNCFEKKIDLNYVENKLILYGIETKLSNKIIKSNKI